MTIFISFSGQMGLGFKRISKWCDRNIWKNLLYSCCQYPDLQQVLIDRTNVRARACDTASTAGNNAERGIEAFVQAIREKVILAVIQPVAIFVRLP